MAKRPSSYRVSEDTKRRILDATLELAGERGYDGTTIAQVIQRSGVSSGAVTWHFPTKESLFVALIEDSFSRWIEGFRRHVGPHADPRPGDRSSRLDHLGYNGAFWRLGLLLALERRMSDSAARQRFLSIRKEVVRIQAEAWAPELGEEVIRRDPTAPERVARFAMALADGYLVAFTAEEPIDLDELTRLSREAVHDYIVRLRTRILQAPSADGV